MVFVSAEQSQKYCEDSDEMYMHLDQKVIVPNIVTIHLKKLDLRYCSYYTLTDLLTLLSICRCVMEMWKCEKGCTS